MAPSPEQTLVELDLVAGELRQLGRSLVTDPKLLDRSERAIAFAIAWLSPSRQQAAPALEAAVAGAKARDELPLASDLLISVDLMSKGLGFALRHQVTEAVRTRD